MYRIIVHAGLSVGVWAGALVGGLRNTDGYPLTTGGAGSHLGVIVHHTDANREWAYDRASSIGPLDKTLDEAKAHDWTVVNMKENWKQVFAFDQP